MLRRDLALLYACLPLVAACPPPLEPAPKDIDGVAHWLWLHYEDADDAAMADALEKVHRACRFSDFEASERGLLSDLSKQELAPVQMEETDPERAQGMFLTNAFACELGTLERILYALDQGDKYTEAYDSYQRTYTSDLEAYQAREEPFITWDVTYEATPLPAARYRATVKGGLRWVPVGDGETTPHGPYIVQRTWLPEPVDYLDTDANAFTLDFQLEVYYESSFGQIAHFYPLWRHMAFNGIGVSTDDESVQSMVLDGLLDWDTRTEELCAQQ